MLDLWNSLSVAMKILWAVTLSASLIFVIQTIMTFLGADADSADFDINTDTDFDAGGADVADAGASGQTDAVPGFRSQGRRECDDGTSGFVFDDELAVARDVDALDRAADVELGRAAVGPQSAVVELGRGANDRQRFVARRRNRRERRQHGKQCECHTADYTTVGGLWHYGTFVWVGVSM